MHFSYFKTKRKYIYICIQNLNIKVSAPQPHQISFLPAFIYVDAAIDHAHKKIMSLGCSASRWARALIRKSIVLSIGLDVFGKGL